MAASTEHTTERCRARHVLVVIVTVVASAISGPGHADASTTPARPSEPGVMAPVVDQPADWFWDGQAHRRAGGEADRFELDDPGRSSGISIWYHLSYVVGGDRLRVFDHNPATTQDAASAIAKSENVAWHVATTVLGRTSGLARPGEIPDWARPRTGNSDGPSAGLIFALADVDLLTPGALVGGLRVAGTGAIDSDGVVTAVRMVDAKLAAARIAGADVFFAPDFPDGAGTVTVVASHHGAPDPQRTIGDWLNTAGFETAGRTATADAGRLALVVVDDIRQALAWLCGRTGTPVTCAISHTAARVPLRLARPYQFLGAPAAPVRPARRR